MYTAIVFNYAHTDYNHPVFKRDYETAEEARKAAEKAFARIGIGRAEVLPVNPETKYNDLPAVWQEERR